MAGPRFCEACGHELHEGARFCGACGHPLRAPEPAAPEPPAEPAAAGPPPPVARAATPPPSPPASPSPTTGAGGDGSRRLLIGLVAALVVAVGAVAVALFLGGGDDEPSRAEREVLLESTASAGPAPFTPDLQPVSATAPATAPSATTTPGPAPTAAPAPGRVAQGPFGGTGDNTLCDRELLVSFLTDPANAAVAREWARVLDVRVQDIPAYVRSLIPTTLTADARVTNHRWENGRAVGYQAVLERGTAVLVDTNGRLIARCRCGNPLLPPQEIAKPVYVGPRWEGFNPTVIVVVVPSPTPIYPPGGVGTLPQSTSPTTRRPTATTWKSEPDEAIRRVKEPFEACVRTLPTRTGGGITAGETAEILAGLRYSATLIDQRSATYRVVVTVTQTGESGTWDVNLLSGQLTPVDANAREVAGNCPGLA